MGANLDHHSALAWTEPELDASLGRASQALEQYVEVSQDPKDLERCIEEVHLVGGALQMLELFGAAMCAEEIEGLAAALVRDNVTQREEAYGVLMRAMLLLPDYLEKLQKGVPDVPLLLLPLMNDLRASHGAPLLTQAAFFSPRLDALQIDSLAVGGPLGTDEGAAAVAHTLRPAFLGGLLQILQGGDAASGLASIRTVFRELRDASYLQNVDELWRLAGALAGEMERGQVKITVAVKLLFGHLDQELRRLIDVGEGQLGRAPALGLAKNILYYLSIVEHPEVETSTIMDDYDLAKALPSEGEIESARGRLSEPNIQIWKTVGEALVEQLARVKDNFDLLARGALQGPEVLSEQIPTLNTIVDTLGMLGLGVLRTQVLGEVKRLNDAVADGQALTDDEVMEVAATLLAVESGIAAVVNGRLVSKPPGDDGLSAMELEWDLRPAEYLAVVDATVHEIMLEMGLVKAAFEGYLAAPDKLDVLRDMRFHLSLIDGGLVLLDQSRVRQIVVDLMDCLDSCPVERLTGDRVADGLADIITSIEYYLEGLGGHRADSDAILDVAETSLQAVRKAAEAQATQADELQVGERPTLPTALLSADKPPLEGVDDEILGVFIEEARAELHRITGLLARWPDDPHAGEVLAIMRRSFHTIKGSGRLVGASTIGELAWASENLLNRVIDGSVPLSGDIEALMGEVVTAIPGLVDGLEQGEAAAIEVAPLMERAAALSVPPGRLVEASVSRLAPPAAVTESTPEDDSPPAIIELQGVPAPLAPAMDPVLLEIFTKETEGHLDVIEGFCATCREAAGRCLVEERLTRTLHTLHGSANMAGVTVVADLGGALETVSQTLQSGELAVSTEMAEIYQDVVGFIRENLTILASNGPLNEAYLANLYQRIQRLPGMGVPLVDLAEDSAAPAELGAEGTEDAAPADEYGLPDSELLEIFLEEGQDLLVSARQALNTWCDGDSSQAPLLARYFHTVKGSARLAGLESLGALGEVMELAARRIERDHLGPQPPLTALLEEACNALQTSLVELGEGGAGEVEADLLHRLKGFVQKEALGALEVPGAARVEPSSTQSEPASPSEGESDEALHALFHAEARELVDQLEASLQALQQTPTEVAYQDLVRRELHTLKGSARLVGLTAVADLSHAMETLLDNEDFVAIARFEVLQRAADGLSGLLDEVAAGRAPAVATDLLAELKLAGMATAEIPTETPIEAAPEATAEQLATPSEPKRAGFVPIGAAEQIRVDAGLLNSLVDNAGEVGIYRARLEEQAGAFQFNLGELDQTIDRLHGQLRQLEMETEAQILFRYEKEGETVDQEFDPLELDRFSNIQQLSRALAESVDDLRVLRDSLSGLAGDAETLLRQQGRVNTDLQEGLLRTRMVPFSSVLPRLRRVVRQTAEQLGKYAELDVIGAQSEVDRRILEHMVAPLEHLLRNAVAHGIESANTRRAIDKPEQGRIVLSLSREGNDVVLDIRDDGAGINVDAVFEAAMRLGLVTAEDRDGLEDGDVLRLIMEPGFTTASEVSQIAGRGVGMDVVSNEIKQLGGALDIDSTPGLGTHFNMHLPYTLAITQGLLVRVGEELYAIPHTSIEGVVRIPGEEVLKALEGVEKAYEYAGRRYEIDSLGYLMGAAGPSPEGEPHKWYPALLVHAGERRVALQVDGLLGAREIVVKSVGPQLSSVRWISGGTILADGQVALILDVTALARLRVAQGGGETDECHVSVPEQAASSGEVPVVRPLVMVVDDSLTVRKVTGRLLERNAMDVVAAKDGVDAVAELQEHHPDVMLLDIEMPRMDGFELARHVRNTEGLKDIPIIVITSRVGDKHRRKALSLGVNSYLGKPYKEQALLDAIRALLVTEEV